MRIPRVAFFTDSFHEVNGVAHTSREFENYARGQRVPFFSLHPGRRTQAWREEELIRYELRNSRFSFSLEVDLSFDPLFWRHTRGVLAALREFAPDLIHITGPGHCGILGAILARHLRVPLVASWHTNVHEYGGRRLHKLLRFLPQSAVTPLCNWAEARMLDVLLRFYRMARLQFAPNPELVSLLAKGTGRPCYVMTRGIDTNLFTPDRRTRNDDEFVIGYVGRLSPEKDVRQFVEMERQLRDAGIENYRFLIVGDGSDRAFLAEHLHRADLPGVLRGEELARAYANMDVFLFPSETDTFGNVVLEALSSGVPAIVSGGGGPQYIVQDGSSGFRAASMEDRVEALAQLYRDSALRQRMSQAARQRAFAFSWSAVFENVYSKYGEVLGSVAEASRTYWVQTPSPGTAY